jgi:hypothetical protein
MADTELLLSRRDIYHNTHVMPALPASCRIRALLIGPLHIRIEPMKVNSLI